MAARVRLLAYSSLATVLAFVACGGVNSGEVVIVDSAAGRAGSSAGAGHGDAGHENGGDSGAAGVSSEDAGEGGTGGQVPSQPGPPRVLSVDPEDESEGADPEQAIVITFSEPLTANTVTAQSVQVKDGSGAVVPGKLGYQNAVVRFQPQTLLALEAPYTLAVSTGVKDSDGTAMEKAFASSFRVRGGAWSAEGALSSAVTGAPVIASDGKGRALAVWSQVPTPNSTVHDVVGRFFTPGQGWGAPVTIDTAAGDALRPVVAMNAAGNAIVAWIEGNSHVIARRYTSNAWEANAQTLEDAGQPVLTIDGLNAAIAPTSTAHVTWVQQNTENGVTYRYTLAKHAALTGTWEEKAQVFAFSDEGNDTTVPALVFDKNGDGYAALPTITYTTDVVWHSSFVETTGKWAYIAGITGSDGDVLGPASLAIDDAGRPMAVWTSTTLGQADIKASVFAGGWSAAVTISSGPSNELPSVRWTGKRFVALWRAKAGNDLVSNSYENTWNAAPFTVSATLHDAGRFAFDCDAQGNALAIWTHAAAGKDGLTWSRLTGTSGAWSSPALLTTAAARGLPAIVMQRDGSASGIWSSQVDATTSGALFQANFE